MGKLLILAQFLSTIVEFSRKLRRRIQARVVSRETNFAKQDCLTKPPAGYACSLSFDCQSLDYLYACRIRSALFIVNVLL